MAQQPVTVKPVKRWGTATHDCCVAAIDPYDSYLKLYRKQYNVKPDADDFKKDQDGNLVYSKHLDFRAKTVKILNPLISTILMDDSAWAQFYRYKHRNEYYIKSADTESFRTYYNRMTNGHSLQIPEGKGYRNRLCLVPITDDQTYFIDEPLMKTLEELVSIYFGLDVKRIDVASNGDNIIFKKNSFDHFSTADIHEKLRQYLADPDLFGIVGICFKIGIFDENNKVIHGEHHEMQTAVCSFGKIGIYHKLNKNTPQWLTIRRAGKVLLHEIGRLFGLGICEYFRCVMNKDVVLDCVPMTLCPICLNKLYFAMVLRNEERDSFEEELPSTTWDEMKHDEEEEACYEAHGPRMDGTRSTPRIYGKAFGASKGFKGSKGSNPSKGTEIDSEQLEGAVDGGNLTFSTLTVNVHSQVHCAQQRTKTKQKMKEKERMEMIHRMERVESTSQSTNPTTTTVHGTVVTDRRRKSVRKTTKGVRIDSNTFNLYERFSNLAAWFNAHQCYREATWYRNRCADLRKRMEECQMQPEQ